MTEAEISNQLLALSGLALSGISVFFALFPACIVALYFFLHRALEELASVKPVAAGGQALLHGGDTNVDLRWMNMAGLAVNYLALVYLTFFYRWES